MSVGELQLVVNELIVILIDLLHLRLLQQIIAVIHQLAERIERTHHLLHIGNDRLLLILGKGCHVMRRDSAIHAELHLLRVDQHKLQLIWVLLIEKRGDDGVQAHRFTHTRGTSNEQMGNLRKVNHKHLIGDGLTERHWKGHLGGLELLGIEHALHRHNLRILVWNLNANGAFSWNRSDDTNAKGRQTQRDVGLQATNLTDAHTFSGRYFI